MFRCELCDAYLPIIQLSKLCPTCYKIRTIIKCYSADKILNCITDKFIVDYEIVEQKLDDGTILKFPKDKEVLDTGSKAETIQIKVEDTDEEAKDYISSTTPEPTDMKDLQEKVEQMLKAPMNVPLETFLPTSLSPLPYSPTIQKAIQESQDDSCIETRSKKNKNKKNKSV